MIRISYQIVSFPDDKRHGRNDETSPVAHVDTT